MKSISNPLAFTVQDITLDMEASFLLVRIGGKNKCAKEYSKTPFFKQLNHGTLRTLRFRNNS
jgi:hypothetical protein